MYLKYLVVWYIYTDQYSHTSLHYRKLFHSIPFHFHHMLNMPNMVLVALGSTYCSPCWLVIGNTNVILVSKDSRTVDYKLWAVSKPVLSGWVQ